MGALKLPRLLSDGMVLQQKKAVRVWGTDEPGRRITVSFLGEEYSAEADGNGEWEIFLREAAAGGPHSMDIRNDAGEEKSIRDILVGDVWICSGQSNMELPMRRVVDRYPEEMEVCENTQIRTFKITEHCDFHGPLKDHLSGEWKASSKDTVLDFSATAYFFARHFYQVTGVPVGLINASLGGSRIESWMSREMLAGYEDFLSLADTYRDDCFVEKQLERNIRQAEEWHSRLDGMDLGKKGHWEREDTDVSEWEDTEIPFFFHDTELKGFIGSVWFHREFNADADFAGKETKLWLGTIVDSDTVYVNSIRVGHTDYQYPPRKYIIPEGVLREGKNVIRIRVISEIGQGRFTDGKSYVIFRGDEKINLAGTWKYRIGAACGMVGETDFVSWKPTGLYHGMMAPCHKYAVAGILWYQGESNTHDAADRYRDLMERMIAGYREAWGETLPFFYVQLPNFSAEIYERGREETFCDWPGIREQQRQVSEIPGTGMAVAIDLGEDNDLHPLQKEGIGFRLAMLAAAKLYGKDCECDGPRIETVDTEQMIVEKGSEEETQGNIPKASLKKTWKVTITFRQASGLHAAYVDTGVKEKEREIVDFELADEKGMLHMAKAEIVENKVILTSGEDMEAIREVRYCYRNTNRGMLLYNGEGFPMSPFCVSVDGK